MPPHRDVLLLLRRELGLAAHEDPLQVLQISRLPRHLRRTGNTHNPRTCKTMLVA